MKVKDAGSNSQMISQILKRRGNTERKHQEKVQNALEPDQTIAKGAADIVAEAGETQHCTEPEERQTVMQEL